MAGISERRWHLREAVGLFAIAALYFAWGCRLSLEPMDEGQIVFASWRTAQGSLPYRDFTHMYGPSLFFLNGALLRWIAEDLLVIRISLVILKAFTAILVYLCARLLASRFFALLAYFLVLGIWGGPWGFNAPYANHYAMTLLLAGIVVFAASRPRFLLACFLAGLCFGLAATFKQTIGAFSVVWFSLFLLARRDPSPLDSPYRPSRFERFLVRSIRWLVLFGAFGAIAAYQATGTTVWNVLALSTPALATILFLAVRELRSNAQYAEQVRSVSGIVLCGLGSSLPVLAYVALYAALGSLRDLAVNTVVMAPVVKWFIPFPPLNSRMLICIAAVVTLFSAVRAWRAARSRGDGSRWVAAGVTGLLLVSLYLVWNGIEVRGGWLHSGAWYGDVFRVLLVLPIGIVWVAVPNVLRDAEGGANGGEEVERANLRRLFFCAAATSLLFLHPGADIWHVLMALPVFLPLLSWELEAFHRVPEPSGTVGRFVSRAVAVLFVTVLAAPFVHGTLRGWWERPSPAFEMPRATGVVGITPQFTDQVELVKYLKARSGRSLLVLTDQQLLYFLAGEPSVVEKSEFVLYLVGAGIIREEDARALVHEREFVQRLQATHPVIVDAVNSRASARFREVFPAVARYIDANYRVEKSIGTYRVLATAGS